MIYTDKTKLAIKVMWESHKSKVDKSGMPYVFHPWHVAEGMTNETETVVALLHDVVEDTDMSFDDIKRLGFDDNVIEALKLLTHDKSVSYEDYIKKIGSNPIATKVKVADLMHNLDDSRLNSLTFKDLNRLEKYRKSLEYLKVIDYKNSFQKRYQKQCH